MVTTGAEAQTGERCERRRVCGVDLAVRRTGAGTPVVCLPAAGHDGRDFRAFAARIGSDYEVIAVDWPGTGGSGADPEPLSAARCADLAAGLLERIAPGEAPILVGNSIGGAAAVILAARRPVRGLVLCNSGGLIEVRPAVRGACARLARFFDAGRTAGAWWDVAFAAYYRLVLQRRTARDARRRIVSSARRIAPSLAQAWRSFARPEADLAPLIATIDAPVWAAWASSDLILPLRTCRARLDLFANLRLSAFRGGHSAFLEDPDAFAQAFLAFAAAP